MTDTNQEQTITRTLHARLEPTGDGRTLELRVVPYNTVATVSDGGPQYEEMWLPGVFDRQLNAANRVLVNFEHEQGFQNVIGRGVELRDNESGLDGTFRILEGADGDKALELINEQVLTGVSLEATVRKSVVEDGVVKRVKARLVNIALCRFPAFTDAKVLAVRDQGNVSTQTLLESDGPDVDPVLPDDVPDDELEPDPVVEPEPVLEPVASSRSDIDDLLARVGWEPLSRSAVVTLPWDGSPARFSDDEWERACVIDRGVRFDTAKDRFGLPVLEPDGALNAHAVRQAAATLAGARGGVAAPIDAKAVAARRLVRYYRQLGERSPSSLTAIAAR